MNLKIRGDNLNLLSLIVLSDSNMEELLKVNQTLIVNGEQYMIVTKNNEKSFLKIITKENGEQRLTDIYDDTEFLRVQESYEQQQNRLVKNKKTD